MRPSQALPPPVDRKFSARFRGLPVQFAPGTRPLGYACPEQSRLLAPRLTTWNREEAPVLSSGVPVVPVPLLCSRFSRAMRCCRPSAGEGMYWLYKHFPTGPLWTAFHPHETRKNLISCKTSPRKQNSTSLQCSAQRAARVARGACHHNAEACRTRGPLGTAVKRG